MCVDAKWWNKVEFVMEWTKSKVVFVENMKTIAIRNGLILTIINLEIIALFILTLQIPQTLRHMEIILNVHQLHLAPRMIVILLVHFLLLVKMPFYIQNLRKFKEHITIKFHWNARHHFNPNSVLTQIAQFK